MISSPRRRRAPHAGLLALVLLGVFVAFGCASKPYEYGHFRWRTTKPDETSKLVVEYGRPGPTIQRLQTIADLPSRLLPFGKKTLRHQLSDETTARLASYMEQNDLTDVHVEVNQYTPGEQWRRLYDNTSISPIYRYTFGAASVVKYTVLPNPIFAKNRYNPYTNSLYLNSDAAIDVLYESADAKNIHTRRLPGSYLVFTSLPVASLFRRSWAVRDLAGYAQAERDWETEQQVYRVLYPRMGAETAALGAAFSDEWWQAPLILLGGSAAGRLVGHRVEKRRERELELTESDGSNAETTARSDESPPQSDSSDDGLPDTEGTPTFPPRGLPAWLP